MMIIMAMMIVIIMLLLKVVFKCSIKRTSSSQSSSSSTGKSVPTYANHTFYEASSSSLSKHTLRDVMKVSCLMSDV